MPELPVVERARREAVRLAVRANNDERKFPQTWLFHHRWGKARGARTARGEPIRLGVVGGRTTAWVAPTRSR